MTGFRFTRRLMGGGSETGIPPSSHTSPGDNEYFSVSGEIFEKVSGFLIPYKGPHRDRDDQVRCAAPLLIFPFSVLASFGVVKLAVMKIKEG